MARFDFARLIDAPLNTSTLKATSQIWHSSRNHRSGGFVSFTGRYKSGSDGRDDAQFVHRTLQSFYELYPVDGIVIDCRQLDYEWGDDLDFPNRSVFRDKQIPLLVVLEIPQSSAFRYAIDQSCHRFNLEEALAEISEAIRTMKSRL